jgi:H+-transporting ATPase
MQMMDLSGLKAQEVEARLKEFGPNSVAQEEKIHPMRQFVGRFWAPIPWLLEATMLVQVFLGERLEASVIGGLLVLNAALGMAQENRAKRALVLLRQQLRVTAHVLREGEWRDVSAEELVPDDVTHLRMGRIVPADVRLVNGSLLVDQSALTGESAAVRLAENSIAYAGSLARGGEATGIVTGTGARTFFGKTAELVRTAEAPSRQQHEIVAVVRDLFVLNVALVVVVVGVAYLRHLSLGHTLPLLLTILLASIPVALPATFTLAAAIGSLDLSRRGVLVTRLSAIHDIASMTILCCDKTGTLTLNQAAVKSLVPEPDCSEGDLLRAAWRASDPAGQAVLDGAIDRAAAARGVAEKSEEPIQFTPFDPALKRAEAVYRESGVLRHYTKGAPAVIAKLCNLPDASWQIQARELMASGERVLAVAAGSDSRFQFLGLIGFDDAVRPDSRDVIAAIQDTGVRVVMVTGDNPLAARTVAEQVGIPPNVCPAESLRGELTADLFQNSVFAGVYPEDKFRLVRAFQQQGAVVGMTGDGVNDAPALRQAEAGVAVSSATDVAKAAAALVLTRPGLSDLLPAFETSRRIFQRIMAYTLNMLAKKIEIMLLLVAGFLLTGHKPLTPLLMVLIIFLNDFITMALATDHMSISQKPARWSTKAVVIAGCMFGFCKLGFSFGVLLVAHKLLHYDTPHIQSLMFATVVLTAQAGVYLLRERGPCWASRPSIPLLASTAVALGVVALFVFTGFQVPVLNGLVVLAVTGCCLMYFLAVDGFKVWLFRRLALR